MKFKLEHNRPLRVASTNNQYMRQIVGKIAIPRPFGSESHKYVGDLIASELLNCNEAKTITRQDGNIYLGNMETATHIIGAHYDSCENTPGADDNASAVAVLLTVARHFGYHKELLFVAFDREEMHRDLDGNLCDGLQGSKAFVQRLLECEKPSIKEAHILEMVGYTSNSQENPFPDLLKGFPKKGDFLGLVGDQKSDWNLSDLRDLSNRLNLSVTSLTLPPFTKETFRLLPDLVRSDHYYFWRNEIPAILWTDTANFRNPNYHKMSDTIDTLDFGFMENVATLMISYLRTALNGTL